MGTKKEKNSDANLKEKPSLTVVLRENYQYMLRLIRRFRLNEEDTKDLFQEVCVEVAKSYPRFEARSHIKTWLYTICQRTVMKKINKKDRHVFVDEEITSILEKPFNERGERIEQIVPFPASPEDEYEKKELIHYMNTVIASMPEEMQKAMLLYLDAEMNIKEIAEDLKITENAARVRIHRGHLFLREKVAMKFGGAT